MDFFSTALAEYVFLFLVTLLIPTFNFISPFRPIPIILAMGTHLPFFTVGLIASVGTTLGVLPLYYVGIKVKEVKKVQAWIDKHPKWKKFFDKIKNRPFIMILVLLWTPLPDQLVGLYGGYEKYSIKKFLLANFIGRAVWYIPLAYFGSQVSDPLSRAWTWFVNLF
ncbi:MAG: VTT domain-containing protein [bacterium]